MIDVHTRLLRKCHICATQRYSHCTDESSDERSTRNKAQGITLQGVGGAFGVLLVISAIACATFAVEIIGWRRSPVSDQLRDQLATLRQWAQLVTGATATMNA